MEFDLKLVDSQHGLVILFGMQFVQLVMNDYIGFIPDYHVKSTIDISSDRYNLETLVDYDHIGN